MCLPSICMSVQTVEVCVHVEMQLQLIYDLNTANTRFTIVVIKDKQQFTLFDYHDAFLIVFIRQRPISDKPL